MASTLPLTIPILILYKYIFNNEKCICVGLDPMQNFEIVINICNNKSGKIINFNVTQWYEFLMCYNLIVAHMKNNCNIESYLFSN